MFTERRRRAIGIVAAAWAAGWAAATPLFLAGLVAVVPQVRELIPRATLAGSIGFGVAALLAGAVGMAIRGAISGAVFALLLGRMERGRTVDELSTGRMLLWGNVVGVLWTVLNVTLARTFAPQVEIRPVHVVLSLAGHAVLATACAAATLWLVRRGAARRDGVGPGAPDVPALGAPPLDLRPAARDVLREPAS